MTTFKKIWRIRNSSQDWLICLAFSKLLTI